MRYTVILLASLTTSLSAQSYPFGSGWELRGSARIDSSSGREVLRVGSGFAYRRDVRLQDGTIEVDVKVTRQRSFVYLAFRMQDDENHEEFYLRPHKSELPDAVQYAPVYQGRSAWQLYHGPGGTAAVSFEPGLWSRLRIVLQGRRAAIFLGDTAKPILLVPRLGHEPAAGYLMLRGFRSGAADGEPIAEYANLRVLPGFVPYRFEPAAADQSPAPGVIAKWTVGPAFTTGDSAHTRIPERGLAGRTIVAALPNGLVELHRQVPLPKEPAANDAGREAAVVARIQLIARDPGTYRLDLGFSDAATVFLDGRPVFYRNDSYLFEGRRDGLIGFDQATLYLPLKAGVNHLAVVVTDHFGGWGIMGRIEPPSGLVAAPEH